MAITFGKTRRRFAVGGQQVEIVSAVTGKDYTTRVLVDGVEAGRDTTPTSGTEAFRNHAVALPLADGATLSVEAGYVGWWGMGLRSRRDGVIVDDSHPGKTFAYPESLKRLVHQPDYDPARQKANLVPIGVDIAMGLLFFFVARETDLTTAALAGAALTLVLYLVQRLTRIDLLGGLAVFGVVMLSVSAVFALIFSSDTLIQLRSTIVGLIAAACFFIDGWQGGRWLGRGLSRYIPYADLDLKRLAIGMGVLGTFMAVLNLVVIWLASAEFWLVYTTFLDIPISIVGFWINMQRARRKRPVSA
jgi:intracellular septation protein A